METAVGAILLLIMQKNDHLQREYAFMKAENSCHKAVGPSVGFEMYIIQYEEV
jgi:hypothetical protein